MITSSFPSVGCCTPVSPSAHNTTVPAKQNTLFAGHKEPKDTVSFKKHGSSATPANMNPASLKMLLVSALLLSGAAAAPSSKSAKGLAVRGGDTFSPQFNQTIDSLVPGLTDAQARKMLQRSPFKPTDNNTFNHVVYDNIAALPAANRTISDDEVKSVLLETLSARFGKNDPQVAEGMALFNDPTLKAVAPDARLRGALVNLKGTLGEAAINAYQDGTFQKLSFTDLDPSFIGRSIKLANETGNRAELNGRYQFEDFRLLSHVIGHETLHSDAVDSVHEERTAHSLDTLIHAQNILENPDVIKNITEFTQRLNMKTMARLNSRDADGNLRLFTSQGNVYPGGKTNLENFGSAFSDVGFDTNGVAHTESTPGNNALHGMLKRLTGQAHDNANFDNATDAVLDQGQKPFTPVDLIALAKVLKLDTGDIPKADPTMSGSAVAPTHTAQTSGARRSRRILWF